MRFPNAFIVGAPRCGTTAMARWLAGHPNVFFCPIKEPHFFNDDASNRKIRSRENYLQLFSGATEQHNILAEGSVWYLYSKTAVPNILRTVERPKFMVHLRDPVSLFLSIHQHQQFASNENVADSEKAWRLQTERARGRRVSFFCRNAQQLVYGEVCSLGSQLERLLGQVPREDVHITLLEDLSSNAEQVYAEACDFLDIPQETGRDFQRVNESAGTKSRMLKGFTKTLNHALRTAGLPFFAQGLRSKLEQWNRRPAVKPCITQDFRRELLAYFEADIRKLEKLTGRDLQHWSHSQA